MGVPSISVQGCMLEIAHISQTCNVCTSFLPVSQVQRGGGGSPWRRLDSGSGWGRLFPLGSGSRLHVGGEQPEGRKGMCVMSSPRKAEV